MQERARRTVHFRVDSGDEAPADDEERANLTFAWRGRGRVRRTRYCSRATGRRSELVPARCHG